MWGMAAAIDWDLQMVQPACLCFLGSALPQLLRTWPRHSWIALKVRLWSDSCLYPICAESMPWHMRLRLQWSYLEKRQLACADITYNSVNEDVFRFGELWSWQSSLARLGLHWRRYNRDQGAAGEYGICLRPRRGFLTLLTWSCLWVLPHCMTWCPKESELNVA